MFRFHFVGNKFENLILSFSVFFSFWKSYRVHPISFSSFLRDHAVSQRHSFVVSSQRRVKRTEKSKIHANAKPKREYEFHSKNITRMVNVRMLWCRLELTLRVLSFFPFLSSIEMNVCMLQYSVFSYTHRHSIPFYEFTLFIFSWW